MTGADVDSSVRENALMTSRRYSMLLLLLGSPCFFLSLAATQTSSSSENVSSKNTSRQDDKDAEARFVNEATERLVLLVGAWRFKEQHFDETGKVIAEVRGTEEVSWQLDKHAVRRVYTRPADGSVYRAECLLAFNAAQNRYEGVWLDNVTVTGPRSFTGIWDGQTKTITYVLTGMDADGATQLYRIVERFLDDERRVATTYRLRKQAVIKLLEVSYRRAVPCPASSQVQQILEDQ